MEARSPRPRRWQVWFLLRSLSLLSQGAAFLQCFRVLSSVHTHPWWLLCVKISSSYIDNCQIEWGPSLVTHYNLIPVSKCSHILRFWGLKGFNIWIWGRGTTRPTAHFIFGIKLETQILRIPGFILQAWKFLQQLHMLPVAWAVRTPPLV